MPAEYDRGLRSMNVGPLLAAGDTLLFATDGVTADDLTLVAVRVLPGVT